MQDNASVVYLAVIKWLNSHFIGEETKMEKEFRGSIVEPGLDSKSPDSNHRYFPQEMVEEDTILLLRRMVLWTWFGFSGIKTALSRHSQVYLGLWGVKGNLDKNIRVIYQLSSLLSLFSSGLRETNQEPRSPTKLINHSVHPCPQPTQKSWSR